MKREKLEFIIISGKSKSLNLIKNVYWNFSSFQVKRFKEIQNLENFDYFTCFGFERVRKLENRPRKPGPYNISWYTKDNTYISECLGQKRVLNRSVDSRYRKGQI